MSAYRVNLEVFAGPMDLLAEISGRDENLPRIDRYDGAGERIEVVERQPAAG